MIRNKSQTHHTAGKRKAETSMESTARNKSKKASLNLSKPHLNSSQMGHEKKNDHSLLSSALHSNRHSAKTLLNASKNIKVINHHQTATKSGVQMSKWQDGTNSALSARILKDIVSYSNIRKDSDSVNRIESMEVISMRKPVSSSNTHRIIEEFSPLTNSNKQNKDFIKGINKTFFVENFQIESKEIEKENFQSLNKINRTEEVKKNQGPENITTREAVGPTTPSPDKGQNKQQKSHQKSSKRSSNRKGRKSGNKKVTKAFQIENQKEDMDKIYEEREQLIFTLERINRYIEQTYYVKYKEIIQNWDALISLKKQKSQLQSKKEQLHIKNQAFQIRCEEKKTQLYLKNRDYIMCKKQKDYITRSAKENFLCQAERIHEDLRQKLTSKADYEHVIMFNMKVVLSGTSHSCIYEVYEEMFANQLTKKFVLIAKKEMGNLSGYDCKLINDFFKKIQELESGFLKAEKEGRASHAAQNEMGSRQFFQTIEELVQEIQQLSLDIESMDRQIRETNHTLEQNNTDQQTHQLLIEEHVSEVSNRISQEYKQTQGKVYNFQMMVLRKHEQEMKNYAEEMQKRERVEEKLREIDVKLNGSLQYARY